MPLQNDFFKPEEIDQQIEALSSNALQTNHLQARNRQHMRLMQHLRRFYRTNKEEDAHTLNAAWERIIHERVHAKLPINTQEKMHEMRSLTENNGISTRKKTPVWRKLGILAAVLLMAALVGSMVVMFSQARQSSGLGGSVQVTRTQKTQNSVQDAQLNLYVTDFTSVYKIDSKTGKKVWVFDSHSPTTRSPIVLSGVVYFSSGDTDAHTYVYALNASDGTLRWKAHYSFIMTVSEKIVYVAHSDTDNVHIDLATLDANTGKLLWQYNPGLQVEGATISNGILYGTGLVDPSFTGVLYALDAVTGRLLWNIQAQDQGFNVPQIVDNIVYATSTRDNKDVVPPVRSGYGYAFDAKTGKQLWRTEKIDTYVASSMPAVSHGVMYIITNDINAGASTLYALRSSDGTIIWHKFIPGDVNDTPLVINGNVYISVSRTPHYDVQILALKAVDGSVFWSHPLENASGTIFGAVLVAGPQAMYVGTIHSQVLALSLADGSQLQVYQVGQDRHLQFVPPSRITLAP